ncbi:MAG: LPS assembly lipoprotein LptE [Geminicoccaceae bacterium]
MSWSRPLARRGCWRLGAAALLPLAAGACGFRPLYGGAVGEEVAAELASIEVVAPATRVGQLLKNRLLDDLDPAGATVARRYRLIVELSRTQTALAIQLDETITRYDLTLAAFFSLHDLKVDGAGMPAAEGEAGPEPAYRSALRRVASYNVVTDPFATLMAEQDAELRAATELSRGIRTLLTLHFQGGPA